MNWIRSKIQNDGPMPRELRREDELVADPEDEVSCQSVLLCLFCLVANVVVILVVIYG